MNKKRIKPNKLLWPLTLILFTVSMIAWFSMTTFSEQTTCIVSTSSDMLLLDLLYISILSGSTFAFIA